MQLLLWLTTVILIFVSNYIIFMVVPNEKVMGAVQRIFYFHVSSAFAAYISLGVLLFSSIAYLANSSSTDAVYKKKADRAYSVISASSEVALLFCLIVLATGMIWGHAAWNVIFRWEPRLVSFLVLTLILLGFPLLRSFGSQVQTKTHAAILGIISAINVPIVIFSIKLLPQSHQLHPEVVGNRGLKHASYYWGFGISTLAMICLSISLIWLAAQVVQLRLEGQGLQKNKGVIDG